MNWPVFRRLVDAGIDEDPRLENTEDIDKALVHLREAVDAANEACVRKVTFKGKFIDIDCHTKQLIFHYVLNRCAEQFSLDTLLEFFRN